MDFQLTDEQRLWKQTVHSFINKELKPIAREINETEEIPISLLQKMGQIGLMGMCVGEAYGGSDLDAMSSAIAIEEIAWGDGGVALTLEAHNELGCAAVAKFGTEQQKATFLSPVTGNQGQLASLALTEPQTGSDLRGIQTAAKKQDGGWLLQGRKSWITNAEQANFIVTLTVTNPDDISHGMSLFIVPRDFNGVTVAPPERKMGAGGTHSHEVYYDQVSLPQEMLLGEEGLGLQQTLEILDGGRISIGALSVGIAQAALEEAISYAKNRETFGKKIANHQAIQWMIADAATEIQAARLIVYYAAWLKDQNRPHTLAGAAAKLMATEMAERVTRNAIQVHGAYGYSREYPVEAMYRAARLMTIGEGTSEIQRMVIARNVFQDGSLQIA